ncbi:CGNR zinc finger domain-containing protein [Actinopolymorpha sp. NPDC004070]|uniref:CGNR zinc finger domain-containing protein n=1 Tax=Actinopolymorpha sp. NPDC004070 TaxID=3154548 RepID=UPI0033BB932C
MHFNHYGGSAARPATALVNQCRETADQPGPPDIGELARILAAHQIDPGRLTRRDADDLAAWAAHLDRAYGEPDPDRQVALVNELLDLGASRPFVSRHGGRPPHLHYFPEDPDVVTRVRAQTAAGLAHVVCDAAGHRLGRCDREGCGAVFLDTSRNGRRRFCSLRCANRVRVADHRARSAR